jgi:DNA-binding NarL/FixJ family response regulator
LTLILIIAKPGALRDGLQALAQALPGFEKVVRADSARTAYESVEENPIKLVLLDAASFGENFVSLLQGIKERRPEIRCIVIVNSNWQRKLAEAAQADRIYLTGFPAAALFEDVQQMQRDFPLSMGEYRHSA